MVDVETFFEASQTQMLDMILFDYNVMKFLIGEASTNTTINTTRVLDWYEYRLSATRTKMDEAKNMLEQIQVKH